MLTWVGLSVAGVLGLLGLVFAGLGWSERRRLAEVVARPTTPIGDVRSGRAEVTGKVLPGNAFDAPISGKPAVYAEVFIEHASPEVKRGSVELRQGASITIDDGTGTAVIETADAQIEIERDAARLYGDKHSAGEAPPTVLALLRAEGRDPGEVLAWTERRIEPGMPLYVLGHATIERMASQAGETEMTFFRATGSQPLLISVGTETEVRTTLRFGARLAMGLALSALAGAVVIAAITLALA